MKKYLEYAWKFINSKFFGYAVVALLIILLAGQCQSKNNLKREKAKTEQNLAAANDSVKIYRDKQGKLTAEKAVWILSEKELKKQNKDLYDKVQQQKGDIISLNEVVFQLEQDTTILHDTIRYLKAVIGKAVQLNKTTWSLPWELDYRWDPAGKNWDRFVGHTIAIVDTNTFEVTHKTTTLDKRTGNIDLIFGEKVVDKKYNVYVTTTYPGLSVKSMEGVFIDPNTNKDIKKLIEKDHWFTGFSVSIGITPTYDFINKKPVIVVGPTIGYTIYQW
jgi:hypothetical protein